MKRNEVSRQGKTIGVMGIPWDENSSYLRGAAKGPDCIRKALHSGSANYFAENGIDISKDSMLQDLGNMRLSSGEKVVSEIENAIQPLLAKGTRVISLGGDHAVTFPILRAYNRYYPDLNLLHIDAHPDLYNEYDGNLLSNACPMARIMEHKLAKRLVQIGIRTLTRHQRQQAERFGVEIIEMRKWRKYSSLMFDGPMYLSVDMDALDPAFAPGVSHFEPGGFSTRELLSIIQNIQAPLVGADIVEFNPSRDSSGMTAMTAAKILKEIAAQMLGQLQHQ
ncbi:MAG: agmatinase [Desulfobacterales bacterium]|nr:agmatinase [Desulfobacterales bacterium]